MYAIADGPPCLEAPHQWTSFHGTVAPVINGAPARVLPRIHLDEVPGYYDLADADNEVEPLDVQPGEFGLPSERLGKTIIYRGRIRARTLPEVRAVAAQMRGAFRRRYEEGRMIVTPGGDWGDIPWSYTARVLSLSCDEKDLYRGGVAWEQPFALSLRMHDPRFYVWGAEAEISGASAATVVATNQGNDDTDPRFTITVPAGEPDIHLENLTVLTSNGHADLWLRDVPAGELMIDFRTRTLALDDGVADGLFDSENSDWWDEQIPGLQPGANSIKVTGGAWEMAWRHAAT